MALLFRQQRVQDEPQAPRPSHAVAQSHSGVEQTLRLVPWPASSPLVSLNN